MTVIATSVLVTGTAHADFKTYVFAKSVAANGEFVAVGELFVKRNQRYLYLFRHNKGEHEFIRLIKPPYGQASDDFGQSMLMDDSLFIVGDNDVTVGPIADAGAVYVYKSRSLALPNERPPFLTGARS